MTNIYVYLCVYVRKGDQRILKRQVPLQQFSVGFCIVASQASWILCRRSHQASLEAYGTETLNYRLLLSLTSAPQHLQIIQKNYGQSRSSHILFLLHHKRIIKLNIQINSSTFVPVKSSFDNEWKKKKRNIAFLISHL